MIVTARVSPVCLLLAVVSVGACSSSTGPGTFATHPIGVVYGTTAIAGRPFALAVSSRGVVLVGLADSARVGLGTLPDTSLSLIVAVGAEPTGVAANPAGTRGYAADQFGGGVDVIDLASHAVIDAVPVSGDPFIVLAANDGNSIFVSSNTDTIYRIASNHIVLGAVGATRTANALALSPDGSHLYASLPDGGVVQDIVTSSMTLNRTLTIAGRPQGVAVSGDGKTLYVANENTSYLSLVDLAVGQVTDSIGVGPAGFALEITPDHKQLYLTRAGAGNLTIVTLATRDTASLFLGGTPRRMAFDQTGTYAVVANEAGWVTFIR